MVASRLRYSNLLGLTSPPLIRSCMHGMWPYLFLRGRMFTKMTLVFERVVCKLWEGRGVYLWKVGYICFLMVRMEYLWNGVCSWRDSSVSSRKDICSASAAIKEKLYMHGSFQFQRCIFVQCICSEVYVCTRHQWLISFCFFVFYIYSTSCFRSDLCKVYNFWPPISQIVYFMYQSSTNIVSSYFFGGF